MSRDLVKVPAQVIDTVRMLAVDAVQKANSGHPGTPMGAAEMTLALWVNFLRFHPQKPDWRDRDRFVLSAGHASMLLYSLLHLFGYDCTMEDLKGFRQMGSRTAGHPEYGHLPGIETTTGPLGQGVANAVGLALGQAMLAGKFNRDPQGRGPVTGRVWCLAGDGCMMEGVASEAASLAGHMGLGNLTVIYDKNNITIDGSTDIAFNEDVALRFKAYGWHVVEAHAYDQDALCRAFAASIEKNDKPTLVVASSVIGYGCATLEGSCATHGAALGAKEVEATKKKIGWPLEPTFLVPDEVRAWCAAQVEEKKRGYQAWQEDFSAWKTGHPDLAAEYEAHWTQPLVPGFEAALCEGKAREKASTRKHSGNVIQGLAKQLPWFVGGSADLSESNQSPIKGAAIVAKAPDHRFEGRNIGFGVREHAMAAITNGLVLHGAWRPYCATFLQFADYMRPSVRLAALMKARSIFVFTHDSVLLGEDGPTHQPVEHLSALRLIPGLTNWRPADGLETGMAWAWAAAKADGPVTLNLTRQNVPLIPYPADFDEHAIWKGGYVLQENPSADVTLIATGSELGLAVDAARLMAEQGTQARIVSMPSVCVFNRQEPAYREGVLGSQPRVVIEAGATALWPATVSSAALLIGVDGFGMSAPAEEIALHFGLTPALVAARVRKWLQDPSMS